MAQDNKVYYDGHLVNFSSGNGYPTIWVNNKNTLLHRYVWEKHNGAIPNGFEIHHKDENKFNFDINNLEMITIKEHHKKHAIKNKLGTSNKGSTKNYISGFCNNKRIEIIAYNNNDEIKFSSIYKASIYLDISASDISRILRGERKTRKGWHFKYAN